MMTTARKNVREHVHVHPAIEAIRVRNAAPAQPSANCCPSVCLFIRLPAYDLCLCVPELCLLPRRVLMCLHER